MPLFMQVGVVRIRFSSRRTERLPSHATMKPRSYIHFPAIQISRRCCSSLFSWVGQSELVVIAGASSLPGGPSGRFLCQQRKLMVPEKPEPGAHFITLGVDSTQL